MEQNLARKNKTTLYALGIKFLSINAILQIFQSLVPLIMQRDLQISELWIGVVTGGVNLIVCLMLLAFSKMKHTINMLLAFSMVLSVSLIVTPLSVKHQSNILFVLMFCVGMMTLSFIKVLANDFTLQVAPAGRENGAIALTKITSTLGGLVALIIMFFLRDEYVFYAMGLLNIVAAVVLFYLRSNIRERAENGDESKRQGNDIGVIRKRAIVLIIILLCYTVYDVMLSTFSRYASNVWSMENNEFAIYQSICLVAAFIAYIPIGKWANEKNQKNFTIIGLILMAVGLFAIGQFAKFHFSVIVFFVLIGVGWAAIAVNIMPILVRGAMHEEVSRLVSYYSVMSNISLVMAPIISGFVLEYLSYRSLYPILAGILIIATCLLFVVECKDEKQ